MIWEWDQRVDLIPNMMWLGLAVQVIEESEEQRDYRFWVGIVGFQSLADAQKYAKPHEAIEFRKRTS
jgi:hypothetical protein